MVLRKHSQAFKRLRDIVADLKQQAQVTDGQNSQRKSHRRLEDKPVFSKNLFHTDSDKYADYVKETERKILELQRHLAARHEDIVENLLPKIEQQISSLTNALVANDAIHQNVEKTARKWKKKSTVYEQAAQAIMQPTQSLYQKLSEHHEFERRLALMIAEREQQRSNTKDSSQRNEQLKLEILALHKRLGKCRQAISVIERDIELAEKRNPGF